MDTAKNHQSMPYHGRKAAAMHITAPRSTFYQGRFGRLFRWLAPWQPPGQTEEEQIQSIVELAETAFEPADGGSGFDNAAIPAAYTYFGQFIDHDITFDPTSSLERHNDPERLHNFRTPRFDLDSIYGRGPDDQPYLYEDPGVDPNNDGSRLLVGSGPDETDEPDLPRNQEGVALIGDPRNDENIIVSQLQLALLRFHNRMVERVRADGVAEDAVFSEAQRLTRWHYQWVVVHDFLKRLCGKQFVDGLLYRTGFPGQPHLICYGYEYQPFMPVEFSVAAYRLGHSMVRPDYHLNDTLTEFRNGAPLPIFGTEDTEATPENLRGFRPLPAFWTVQWDRFVAHQGADPQKSRLIDAKLAPPLMRLSASIAPERPSLAFRNLLRGWRMGLPSGQAVARYLDTQVIEPDQSTPLWLYILKEAESLGDGGQRLGPVGARIVGETLVGLLAGDPLSYYRMQPSWTPTLDAEGDTFELRDLLRHAGAPMTRADVDAHFPSS